MALPSFLRTTAIAALVLIGIVGLVTSVTAHPDDPTMIKTFTITPTEVAPNEQPFFQAIIDKPLSRPGFSIEIWEHTGNRAAYRCGAGGPAAPPSCTGRLLIDSVVHPKVFSARLLYGTTIIDESEVISVKTRDYTLEVQVVEERQFPSGKEVKLAAVLNQPLLYGHYVTTYNLTTGWPYNLYCAPPALMLCTGTIYGIQQTTTFHTDLRDYRYPAPRGGELVIEAEPDITIFVD